jgi:hypothetical protein
MKTKYFMMVCIAMLTMGTIQAPAQGLGGLLKKGKKSTGEGQQSTRWNDREQQTRREDSNPADTWQ